MNICRTCQIDKSLAEFSARRKNGVITSYFLDCKLCNAAKAKKYRKDNPELVKAQVKKSCEKHHEDRKARDKRWYYSHQDEKQKYRKEKFQRIKQDPIAYAKYKEDQNKRTRQRLKENPAFKFKNHLRSRMHQRFQKRESTMAIVNCEVDEFTAWMKYQLQDFPDLSIENYGEKWHLDHVLPCASFNFDEQQRKECYHWSNISPLESNKNMGKTDRIDHDSIKRQIERYKTYIAINNIQPSKYDIENTYTTGILSGALITTADGKPSDSTRGNDLGRYVRQRRKVIASEIGKSAAKLPCLDEKLDQCIAILSDIRSTLIEITQLLRAEGSTTKRESVSQLCEA